MNFKPGSTVIVVRGIGHIPAKKNSKQIIPGRNGKRAMLITKPEYQKVAEQLRSLIRYQLSSNTPTSGGGMLTVPPPPSLTA